MLNVKNQRRFGRLAKFWGTLNVKNQGRFGANSGDYFLDQPQEFKCLYSGDYFLDQPKEFKCFDLEMN